MAVTKLKKKTSSNRTLTDGPDACCSRRHHHRTLLLPTLEHIGGRLCTKQVRILKRTARAALLRLAWKRTGADDGCQPEHEKVCPPSSKDERFKESPRSGAPSTPAVERAVRDPRSWVLRGSSGARPRKGKGLELLAVRKKKSL